MCELQYIHTGTLLLAISKCLFFCYFTFNDYLQCLKTSFFCVLELSSLLLLLPFCLYY